MKVIKRKNTKPFTFEDYVAEPGVTDPIAKKIAFVRVVEYPQGNELTSEPMLSVETHWKRVDRTHTYSIGLPMKHMKLAMRIVDAQLYGGFYTSAERRKDNAGKSYINSVPCVRMRTANADLLKIGY